MPFFSVIIPVYNGAGTIKACLESVKAQSFSDYEVVVINDGSTDDTVNLIEDFQSAHPKLPLRVITQENQGLGASRNTGISMASGIFCALLDADDLWKPEKLKSIYKVLEGSGTPLLYHRVETFGRAKTRVRACRPVHTVRNLLIGGNPLVPSAVCLRTDMAQKHPFSTEPGVHGAEDLLLWCRLLHQKITFRYLPEVLTSYRDEGGMSTRLEEHLQKVHNVLKQLRHKEIISESTLKQALQRKEYEAARFYHKRGHYTLATKHYAASPKNPKVWLLRLLNDLSLPA